MNNTAMVKVVFDDATLIQNRSGSILGVFFLEIDGQVFPQLNWADFPVALTCGWLHELDLFVNQQVNIAELHFMDGPFLLRLQRQGDQFAHLGLVERTLTGELVSSAGLVSLGDITESLFGVAERVLARCRDQGIDSRDVEQLAQKIRGHGSSAA